jgi:hypothetical protein
MYGHTVTVDSTIMVLVIGTPCPFGDSELLLWHAKHVVTRDEHPVVAEDDVERLPAKLDTDDTEELVMVVVDEKFRLPDEGGR